MDSHSPIRSRTGFMGITYGVTRLPRFLRNLAMTEGWILAYFILSLCTPPIIKPNFSTLTSFRFTTPIILPS